MQRRSLTTVGAMLALGSLAACGGSSAPAASSSAASTPSSSATVSAGGSATAVNVSLTHVPHGVATLEYDGGAKSLKVTVHLVGLAPGSSHPMHIHAGSCAKQGDVAYPLNAITADKTGVGDATTTVSNIKEGGIPSGAWYVNVHNGPGLMPADQFLPIACGDVTNTGNGTSVSAPLTMGPPPPSQPGSPDQAATGKATLSIVNGALMVTVDATGLMPASSHAAHIHVGSCEAQGPVVHPLNSLIADAGGHATSTTTVSGVSAIPLKTWYVNVHRTLNVAAGQSDFDPILCGDVGGSAGL